MPRRSEPVERTCLATRAVRPTSEMIRFVIDPAGAVVADLKAVLPGRGAWVTATRRTVALAEKKRVFGRAFRAEVTVAPGLADRVDALLARQALGALGLARKAGLVVTGFTKVEAAIASTRSPVVGILQASDGAEDGARKIEQALRRRFGEANADGIVMSRDFTSGELDLALGGAHVIHAALHAGPAAVGALARLQQLARYRREEAETVPRMADSELAPIAPDAGTDYEPANISGIEDETPGPADLDDGPRGGA